MNTKSTTSTSKPEYKYLHLTTGDEIFAICDVPNNSFLKVSFPMCLEYTMSTDDHSISLMPYCPFSENNEVLISINNIVSITSMHESYIEFYKNAIASVLKQQSEEYDASDDITLN